MGELERVIHRQATGATPALKVDVASMTGGGDASEAEQQAQTALLTTIDGDTGTLAALSQARSASVGAAQTGIMAYGVRDDALSAAAEAEGEASPLLIDANGALWVQLAGALDASVDDVGVQSMPSGAATTTAVADAATSTTLLASSDSRKGFSIRNLSSAILYIKYGTGATAADSHIEALAQGERFGDAGVGVYTGIITGIWASDAGGSAIVTSW